MQTKTTNKKAPEGPTTLVVALVNVVHRGASYAKGAKFPVDNSLLQDVLDGGTCEQYDPVKEAKAKRAAAEQARIEAEAAEAQAKAAVEAAAKEEAAAKKAAAAAQKQADADAAK